MNFKIRYQVELTGNYRNRCQGFRGDSWLSYSDRMIEQRSLFPQGYLRQQSLFREQTYTSTRRGMDMIRQDANLDQDTDNCDRRIFMLVPGGSNVY